MKNKNTYKMEELLKELKKSLFEDISEYYNVERETNIRYSTPKWHVLFIKLSEIMKCSYTLDAMDTLELTKKTNEIAKRILEEKNED